MMVAATSSFAFPVAQSAETTILQGEYRSAVEAALGHAYDSIPDDDWIARAVFLTALKEFGGSFRQTREIASFLKLPVCAVKDAKARIKYHCSKNPPPITLE